MHRRTWRSRRMLVLLTAGMLTGYAVTMAAPPSAPTGTIALAASHGGNPPPRDVNCTGCVDTADIADGAVTDAKLATTGLDASRLTVGTLDPALLGTGIDATRITIGYLSTDRIAHGEIKTAHLADASNIRGVPSGITTAKIENGSITSDKLVGDLVATGHLRDQAVTSDKLAPSSVDNHHLLEGAVATDQLRDAAVTTAKLDLAAVTTAQLGDLAVTNAKLAAAAVGTAQLGDAAVTSTKLAAAAVDTAQLANGAVTIDKLAAAAVDTAQLADGAVTIDKLATAAVGTQQLADGAVTTAKLASGAVGNDQLATGAVTPAKMASNAAAGTSSGLILRSADNAATVASAALNQADAALHTALVTGQMVVRCECPTATQANVRYDIVRTHSSGAPYVVGGMSYTVLLNDGTDSVLPISLLDFQVPSGQSTYVLRAEVLDAPDVSGADSVTFHSAVVNVVDLGR